MSRSEKVSGIWSSLARWLGLSRTTTLAIQCSSFSLALQELDPLFELFADRQGIARRRSDGGCAILGLMPGVDRDFLQRPAGLACAMGKVVTEVMKGHVDDDLPFLVAS